MTLKSIDPNDCNVPCAGADGISSLCWSPTANTLASSNWDSTVSCWEVIQEQNGLIQANPKAQVTHENKSSVFDCCFSSDGTTIFSGGCDNAVRMWQIDGPLPVNNVAQQIGAHDMPVKSLGFIPSTNLVVSGGWDRKLKFWDTRSPNPVGAFDLPERVYDLDVRDNLLVVATAGRHIITYDVSGLPREQSRFESPLKYQSRCISCFPDSKGFAIGSIEGRVGIKYLNELPGKVGYAFRCHRQEDNLFSVNAIAFHSRFGTCATVGSDGAVNFWDLDSKQRLKAFPNIERTISCASFNASGNMLAYASSYDWSKGCTNVQHGNEIFVHSVMEDKISPMARKAKSTSGFKR